MTNLMVALEKNRSQRDGSSSGDHHHVSTKSDDCTSRSCWSVSVRINRQTLSSLDQCRRQAKLQYIRSTSLLSADMLVTPSQQTNLHYSLNNLPWCHWANWANTVTKASGLIIKLFLHQFVDALSSRCCELTPAGTKVELKTKIMGCEVKQQQPLVFCLSAGLSQVKIKREMHYVCVHCFWLQAFNKWMSRSANTWM